MVVYGLKTGTMARLSCVLGHTSALSGWRRSWVLAGLRGMSSSRHPYRGIRFPAEIIAHAVWLYHCFSLSLRDVELILAARGVTVSYESIRDWAIRFGRQFAATLKRRRPNLGINSIWTRCLSGSGASRIIFGARWIRAGLCWTSSSSNGGTPTRQSVSFGNYSQTGPTRPE